MSDNVPILEPTSGNTPTGYVQSLSAAKQVGGANGPKHQRVQPTYEDASGAQLDVKESTGLPVQVADGKVASIGAMADAAANAGNVGGARSVISLLKAIAAWALAPVLAAGEAHLGQVGGETAIAGNSFTRPADTTPYVLGDLIANNVAAASVVPVDLTVARKNAGTGRIPRARLTRSKPESGAFRIHLFRAAPTVQSASGDNLAISTDGALNYLGAFDVTTDRVFSDGAKGFGVPVTGAYIAFETGAATQKLYALLEARGAVTPASAETFTIALEVDRD
ncbi:hypothetical protein [Aureimonas phyllosphaerae]|uniref:Uncharacterized protein n=1 Tax=Aureimonas phyllosphaerae TaxID=1166078 RepID=A0A7W6FW82_9HYPH|nr:hypothetical protein [Aureimonas phyllosphaerae]MBB3937953.1 hypothetical protein [Aureimonas phyllosphaerae]MBB3961873.1 hypothetical protein [Aureimonas phyllosphaerae]SFF54367.1 hypothetical protein SAMN05216566_1252 [Aureimonas phyllosphaerae]